MNYNSWIFWGLFALVLLPYWRLSHRHQNSLLLAASYLFYGFWDYRFLFLILLSTAIDFVAGRAIAGEQQPPRQLKQLAALLLAASFVLCSNIDYGALTAAALAGSAQALLAALPGRLADLLVPAVTVGMIAGFGLYYRYVEAQPEARRRKLFMVASMVANLSILGRSEERRVGKECA